MTRQWRRITNHERWATFRNASTEEQVQAIAEDPSWLRVADQLRDEAFEEAAVIADDRAKKGRELLGEFAAGDELSPEQEAGESLVMEDEEIAEAVRALKGTK